MHELVSTTRDVIDCRMERVSHFEILREVLAFLEGRNDCVQFGAMAVNHYVGMPRATEDVDVMVAGDAEAFSVELKATLNQRLSIAAGVRCLKNGNYVVYLRGDGRNRKICDVRPVGTLPEFDVIDGWQVMSPRELFRAKLVSSVNRMHLPKGQTDYADLMRLRSWRPELASEFDAKDESPEVQARLAELLQKPIVEDEEDFLGDDIV